MPIAALRLIAAAVFAAATTPTTPTAPAAIKPYLDYARALQRTPACPPGQECVQLSQVEFTGNAREGDIGLTVHGANVGRMAQTVFLLSPATTFSVQKAHFSQGSGSLRLQEGSWYALIAPGSFTLELQVTFEPGTSVPMELAPKVAQVRSALRSGSLVFDDTSAQHGGGLFIKSQNETASKEVAPPNVHITRAFRYGSVVTFTYAFSVTGLREQTRLPLPLLGGEVVESLSPTLSYTSDATAVHVTLSPGNATVQVSGHFNQAPTELHKPADQPFEGWLFSSDSRHPVELESDGIEVDTQEVHGLPTQEDARAFMLHASQKLVIKPVQVEVDSGLHGTGRLEVYYRQAAASHPWLAETHLFLNSPPTTDRLILPTPFPAHYASVSGQAVRLFGEPAAVSVRLSGQEQLRVQWREVADPSAFLSWLHLNVPGQSVQLDAVETRVDLLPGYVPIAVLGSEHTTGDLLEGVQLYAVLLAMLGMALARGARFPVWAIAVLGVLLAGLYTVEDFPREVLLVLLTGCAILARLPTALLQRLRERPRTHRFIAWCWVLTCIGALSPSVMYARERLVAALYPWENVSSSGFSFGEASSLAPARQRRRVLTARDSASAKLEREEEAPEGGAPPPPPPAPAPGSPAVAPSLEPPPTAGGGLSGKLAPAQRPSPADEVDKKGSYGAVSEKTVRPVPLTTTDLPANTLEYSFGARLPDQPSEATLILAGPLLRGLWLVSEIVGLSVVIVLLFLRSRRLWWPREVA